MKLRSLADRITPNATLLIDAAACFAGAALLLLSATVWNWFDLPDDWRQPIVVALFGFSVLLVITARYKHRLLIALVVLGNIVWTLGGTVALFITGSLLGMLLIALVVLVDAVMTWLQSKGLSA